MMAKFTAFYNMSLIYITDIESAINYWRDRAHTQAPDTITLAPELLALAEVYALMAFRQLDQIAEDQLPSTALAAWMSWYATTPDTPCIAICSTSQGDATCKGCGRSFDEVQHWLALSPVQKRWVWHRITAEGTAWRFNRYAERAPEQRAAFTSSAGTQYQCDARHQTG
jgi:predicted Fe-S protein YdhL (DUF1289 family)